MFKFESGLKNFILEFRYIISDKSISTIYSEWTQLIEYMDGILGYPC